MFRRTPKPWYAHLKWIITTIGFSAALVINALDETGSCIDLGLELSGSIYFASGERCVEIRSLQTPDPPAINQRAG